MARPERFELPAPKFVAWCSIQLSYGRTKGRVLSGRGMEQSRKRTNVMTMDETPSTDDKKFHGWRLIGVITLVIVALAIVSAIVDWIVLR